MIPRAVVVGALLGVTGGMLPVGAEDQAEINRRLLQKIEQLEQQLGELQRQQKAVVAAPTPTPAAANWADSARVADVEQKLKVIERQNEIAAEAAAERAKTAPVFTAGASGFQLRSADTNFVIKLRGYVQADARFFPDDHAAGTANDTFLLRRVRPILEGTLYEKYDFRIMTDFASGITSSSSNNGFLQDGYLNARFLPELQLQVGKFKEPVGLERLQSGANLLFIERGLPTQLLPNRDAGIQLQGELLGGRLTYQVGAFNGVADGGSGDQESADDDKDLAARLFALPFKTSRIEGLRGLGLGIAGTIGNQEGALRSYSSAGQQKFFGYRSGDGKAPATANVVADGEHWRLSPQGYYYWGPIGVFGEYAISDQHVRRDDGKATFAAFQNSAWQVAVSYVITGEDNSFKGIVPRKPFGAEGWGALELAGRVGELSVDKDAFPIFADPATSGAKEFTWALGLNWHLNRNVKFSLSYEHTKFDTVATPTNPLLQKGEDVIFTRAQVSF